MLRRSFVPPTEIRRLRDYTRLRVDLVEDRSRPVQRLEKLLEDALIKLSTVATDIMGVSGRAMIDALIAAQFAVASIRAWWQHLGRGRYPHATTLTITAD